MKYIYDIILNFNERFYEFYEWEDTDNIEYIKRIPVVKVKDSVLHELRDRKVCIDLEFIKLIYNKCEIYTNCGIKRLEYACLFCSDNYIFALEFNEKGESTYRSDLYLDEAIDVLNYTKKLKLFDLEYSVLSELKNPLITRKEQQMINFIKRELNLICKDENMDKLKYIYYECFSKLEENTSKIVSDLERYIFECPNKVFDLLMLSCSKGLQN